MDIGAIWDLAILNPLINVMIWLSDNILFGSFGLTIILLTIFVRTVMYPLTMKQLHATKSLQDLTPKLNELKKKYAKDKEKLAKEQMRLYRESGVSATGCLIPTLIQLPVWIALYQSIIRVMAVTPEDFLNLSDRLYPWDGIYTALPVDSNFLFLDLTMPNMIIAVLVGMGMYLQQKMTATKSADPKQASTAQLTQTMMPLMFGFFAMIFPSGLALYWFTSTFITIIIQYFVTGWGGLQPWVNKITGRIGGGTSSTAKVIRTSSGKEVIEADVAPEDSEADITPQDLEETKDQSGKEGYKALSIRKIKRKQKRNSKRPKRR